MISVLCLLACNHIIWKLKMVYQDVCCSVRAISEQFMNNRFGS